MKVEVDRDVCIVSGMCASVAPEVFEISDDGKLAILTESVPAEQRDQAAAAELCCPTEAISLNE